MKSIFFHKGEDRFNTKILSFHPEDPVTVLQIEIDPASGKMLEQHLHNAACIACIFNICFEYFDHALKFYAATAFNFSAMIFIWRMWRRE